MKVDYTNKNQVIAFARKLGNGCIVIKHKAYKNYNITHEERRDRYSLEEVVWTRAMDNLN